MAARQHISSKVRGANLEGQVNDVAIEELVLSPVRGRVDTTEITCRRDGRTVLDDIIWSTGWELNPRILLFADRSIHFNPTCTCLYCPTKAELSHLRAQV